MHDIGKNIVGVVLQCNNFEVIDLGVMVTCESILETARRENADIIGLSGLITPSLDEMVHVASEMQRQAFELPLLIGGATTSPAHTSVKIDPQYSGPVVYVKDASRAVGVAQKLVSETERQGFVTEVKAECGRRRDLHAGKSKKAPHLVLDDARENCHVIDWASYAPPVPSKLGVTVLENYPLKKLVERIDWMPFFNAWQFAGKFPDILSDQKVGDAASKLFDDAQDMLSRILEQQWLTANGVFGLFPAGRVGADDIEIYAAEDRGTALVTLNHLRQQKRKPNGAAHFCLADFVAPKESGVRDYVGAFAVTAGIGIDTYIKQFESQIDDYSSLLLKALADRLAEAFAEHLHERVRKEYWGYANQENLDNRGLIAEEYQGIRPAPGYPACPDHTEKAKIWQLLDPEATAGISITESFAMYPTAAVSGWYFSHPESRYFALGKIDEDQLKDYANRKGWSETEARRWLAPNL